MVSWAEVVCVCLCVISQGLYVLCLSLSLFVSLRNHLLIPFFPFLTHSLPTPSPRPAGATRQEIVTRADNVRLKVQDYKDMGEGCFDRGITLNGPWEVGPGRGGGREGGSEG